MTEHAVALFAAEESWHSILESPAYFLHRIDLQNQSFEFIHTNRETLNSNSFLDGRTPLSHTDKSYILPIKDSLEWYNKSIVPSHVNRFIFHMSFCGSTLVARALDKPGTAIGYKEPQILLELAEIKAANIDWFRNKVQWQTLVGFVLSQLNKQWSPGESVVIKPSNWANSMLPQLIEDGGFSRALFLSTSPIDFLISVFRGGGERIQFTYSVLKHLLTAFPEFTKIVANVESQKLTTVEMFARLSLILHAIQCKAFERAKANSHLKTHAECSYQDLQKNPATCLELAATTLDLNFTMEQLNHSINNTFSQHAKITQRNYNTQDAQHVDQQVLAVYGDTFSRTFTWAEKNLIPSDFF
ncbi:hypothetical protein [Arenicella xantha]|uniref:Sulfotransferase family protein n=1 Tax=Arenicella xantha TaxID=644221 RepID=A0A395JK48_9GAMM|nr:hypothetical protein [Arenicella xantha]RBP51102.1 hypothetical protein DFR28_102521 [Arenicella xantha]